MKPYAVAFLIYGDNHSHRNALTEEKYQELANAFLSAEFIVESVLYHDASVDVLRNKLLQYDAVLVWVNPIEQGKNRSILDTLLTEISNKGIFVSTHPEVILKIGTKDVLYKTKDMGWGSPIQVYPAYEEFIARFPASLQQSYVTILKQYRGNGGNGVCKVKQLPDGEGIMVIPAKNSHEAKIASWDEFFEECKPYFAGNGLLIEQACNPNLANGMVRCYLSGNRVVGFGYRNLFASK
jgi:glutathione synthase/RimK-type ligase-like ATP-grasp enzyme